jgi:hydroxyacylglutathione hydrolase
VDRATRQGYRITYILETHRNEDYVIGSLDLAARTGAEVWHADGQLDYQYGRPVEDGCQWQAGRLKLVAIHTPGHTPGSMSYVLHEPSGSPWIAFTGDALFAGDVGRVDLVGMERAEEMAGDLYESLFEKLLPLGDEVILCPAHGAGSVCGTSIAERSWTTIGLERRLNPKLELRDRDQFVANVAVELERPPYFARMEAWNIEGPPPLEMVPNPPPLAEVDFWERAKEGFVLDTRSELGFSAAHVPDALSIWQGGLASFAGWFVPYEEPVLLVTEEEDPDETVRTLVRLGYDRLAGCLAGGLLSWHTAGKESRAIETVTVQELCRRLDEGRDTWILDVRSEGELDEEGRIEGAHHIHITQLPYRLSEVPKTQHVDIFCGSGLRSMTAASLLKREGWADVAVVLGGVAGWNSVSCAIE